MKDTHIYNRMSNPNVVKTYLHLLKTMDYVSATDLYNNIKLEANDHPRFSAIEEVYNDRFKNKV